MENRPRKPPLGVKPKIIHNTERVNDISGAIIRYLEGGFRIPVEWIEEYNNLVLREEK